MSIEVYVLSVLRRGSVHGYELRAQIRRPSIAPVSNNSLYPALTRLERSGAVTKTVEQQEGRPARNVYTITQSGRSHLLELVSSLPPELARDDEEFLLRVSFFDELPVSARLNVLQARRQVTEQALAHVQGLLAGPLASGTPSWRRRAQEQLVERLNSELNWIEELRIEAERP